MSAWLANLFDRIGCFFARRELRKPVDWNSCEWSPQKAAERRMKERLIEQYAKAMRIQIGHQTSMIMMQARQNSLMALAAKAQAERARSEYAKQYEIYSRRQAAQPSPRSQS